MRRASSTGLTVVFLLLAPALTSVTAGQPPNEDQVEKKAWAFIDRPRSVGKSSADADQMTKLLIERYEAAMVETFPLRLRMGEGFWVLLVRRDLSEAVRHLVDAELELTANREQRLALLEGHVDFLRGVEKATRDAFLRGVREFRLSDVARARYFRIDGEIRLLIEKRENDLTKRR